VLRKWEIVPLRAERGHRCRENKKMKEGTISLFDKGKKSGRQRWSVPPFRGGLRPYKMFPGKREKKYNHNPRRRRKVKRGRTGPDGCLKNPREAGVPPNWRRKDRGKKSHAPKFG